MACISIMINSNRRHREDSTGFTLAEFLVAMLIGSLLVSLGAAAMVNDLRGNNRTEALQRKRDTWNRAVSFIESEIAMGERIITDPNAITVPTICGFDSNDQVRMAIDIRRDLPLVIYAVRSHASLPENEKPSWKPDVILKRCGPLLGSGAEPGVDYLRGLPSSSVVLDDLQGPPPGAAPQAEDCQGFCVSSVAGDNLAAAGSGPPPSTKAVNFTLLIKGLSGTSYRSGSASYSRINPLEPFPVQTSACDKACTGDTCKNFGGYYFIQGTISADSLTVPLGIDPDTTPLLCGLGGGDTMVGSPTSRSNILDPGRLSTIAARVSVSGNGRNYLFGTPRNDSLTGGLGDDTLVGRGGGDVMVGGGGNDLFRPWGNDTSSLGNATITGGSGMDVVFLSGARENYSIPASCYSASTCSIATTSPSGSVQLTLNNINRLVFGNSRVDLTN